MTLRDDILGGAQLLVVIMQMVMANKYGLDFGWHFKWTVFELDGKTRLARSNSVV
jgi:hypothetical protein